MRRNKLLLLGVFTAITAVAGSITLSPRTVQAAPTGALEGCGNSYCNPGSTTCSYNWNSACNLSGVPPHYCDGWEKCNAT